MPYNFHCSLFADDLSVWTALPRHLRDGVVLDHLRVTQKCSHEWGRKHQVTFDPAKESLHIIHPTVGSGENFSFLGVEIDPKLKIVPCIDKILEKCRPKMRALLRFRNFLTKEELISQ